MIGNFFSVGTGPGDPKLMTYKAVETIRNCDIIAVPDSGANENAVLKIVSEHISDKEIVYCDMPMIRDKAKLLQCHNDCASKLAVYLDDGKSVAFLTLGDPTIYSTAMYVHQILQSKGYKTAVISGVPSFCAVAAALNIPLCEGGEMLHIIPASYKNIEGALEYEGNHVLMKSGKSIGKVKPLIDNEKKRAMAVECCGMEQERIHLTLDTIDENSSYFSVIVAKPQLKA